MSRCLCVFSRILGWSVFGRYVDRALAEQGGDTQIEYLNYDPEVYRYRVPAYRDLADSTRTAYRLARLMRDTRIEPAAYDAFIFQGHDLGVPFRAWFGRPVGIIADTTPALVMRRGRRPSSVRGAVGQLWRRRQDARRFRPMFAQTAAFLVLSDLVKRSLTDDYGVDPSRVYTVGPPIYERAAMMSTAPKAERPVILFVGNDFSRKGGHFLLDLYARHYRGRADLWIVSNSVGEELGPGVKLYSNIPNDKVLELMAKSHLFVFPSYHDELGLVLAEAAAMGLPIIARETGGQSEYVHDGRNGFLMPVDDDLEAWKNAVDSIILDQGLQQRFSAYSRELAARLCTQARFDAQMAGFLSRVLPSRAAPRSPS